MRLIGILTAVPTLVGTMSVAGEIIYVGGNPYQGEYVITPTSSDQTLDTTHKTLMDDLLVKAIPYAEVSNPKGMTIIIGG